MNVSPERGGRGINLHNNRYSHVLMLPRIGRSLTLVRKLGGAGQALQRRFRSHASTMNRFAVCTVTMICLVGTTLAQSPITQSGEYKIEETHVASILEGLSYPSDFLSADGLKVAYSGKNPFFSPDSYHLAYIKSAGKELSVVLDGQEVGECDGVGPDGLIFSPDSKHLAYAAQKGGKWMVVVDGMEDVGYDKIGEHSLVFSSDGKRVAYWAVKDEKRLVVVDGRASSEFDGLPYDFPSDLLTPVFSPDGKRVAYVAQKGGKWMVVVDGKAGTEYDRILSSPLFSRDGKRMAYLAQKGEKWVMVLNGKTGTEYDRILLNLV